MNQEILQWLNTGLISVVVALISIVGYFVKKSFDGIEKRLGEIEQKMIEQREELLQKYATKEEIEKDAIARKEIWVEVNNLRERVAKVEK